ncbi:MAG TPA: molybdenum cofactor guanylyltransferase [Anaeromyxobacteraceae bacterium]|nr:molybdenum cofactor guanylyltransferase [Anaeromyxobacteraceae bacterium]
MAVIATASGLVGLPKCEGQTSALSCDCMQHHPRSPALDDCTGVLFAGGSASRLAGLAKGLLRVDGEPILARSLRLFGELFPDTLVVANDARPYASFGARMVPDLLSGKGAPGALHAALSGARTGWVFAVGCDMPFLSREPILWLAGRRGAARAVVVEWRGRLEPLHAFWSRDCIPILERLLREGCPSMWAVASTVGALLVPEEEWQRVDPAGCSFANVNTVEDAARLGIKIC